MKLISINIECNRHTDRVFNFLKKEKADVVCIQELLEDDFDLYKKELNLNGVFQPWSFWKSPKYPQLRGKKQGVAIFAKEIIKSGSTFYVGQKENILKSFDEYMSDEKFQKNRALVWVDTRINNENIYRFITTQLPVTKEGEVTPYQLEVINLMLHDLEGFGEFVLCGDMNAPRGCQSFSRIAEKYKDNIPLEYKTSIDQNLHKVKGIQFMVDGLFTTPLYKASHVRLQDGISDHMAIIAKIDKIAL